MASSTVTRILDTSLRLFNEHGFQNVPASRIASEVGMSAGNLAYHFKSKRDIVIAVFPLISEEVRGAKRPEGPFYPEDGAARQIAILKTLWRYRFFFNGLIQLLNSDRALGLRYSKLQDGVLQTIEDLFDELVLEGYFRQPLAPVTTRRLALNLWMVWLSWLRFEQIRNPRQQTPSKAALLEGVMMNTVILQPYLSQSFCGAMLAALRKKLSPNRAAKDD